MEETKNTAEQETVKETEQPAPKAEKGEKKKIKSLESELEKKQANGNNNTEKEGA